MMFNIVVSGSDGLYDACFPILLLFEDTLCHSMIIKGSKRESEVKRKRAMSFNLILGVWTSPAALPYYRAGFPYPLSWVWG